MSSPEPQAKPFEQIGSPPFFAEEKDGWKGYVEWEKYPAKKKQAAELLSRYSFPGVSIMI